MMRFSGMRDFVKVDLFFSLEILSRRLKKKPRLLGTLSRLKR